MPEWYLFTYCMRVTYGTQTLTPLFSIIPKHYITLHNHLLLLLFFCSVHHYIGEPSFPGSDLLSRSLIFRIPRTISNKPLGLRGQTRNVWSVQGHPCGESGSGSSKS